MPKINVYLPDDLAEAVREMGVPVSAICQRALEASVRRVTAIRQATLGEVNIDDPGGRMAHFTQRSRRAVALGLQAARAAGAAEVGTEHLLAGVIAEGANLALEVLRAMEIDPAAVRQRLGSSVPVGSSAPTGPENDDDPASPANTEDPGDPRERAEAAEAGSPGGPLRFSGLAASALELAVTEAIGLGHNYIGCEHLLLGLVSEPDGKAGQILRGLGAEYRPTRRAISAALAGYTYIQAQKQSLAQPQGGGAQPQGGGAQGGGRQADVARMLGEAVRREMQPVVDRLERLEQRVGPADE